MELYPAIDLRAGRCVRLTEGDFAAETVYSDDPARVARDFASAGAGWIHVVDLDAALTGNPANRAVFPEIVGAVGPMVKVQAAGGVRREEDAAELFGAGVARVVVGTSALEQPEVLARMAERWPRKIAAGIDHRGGEVRLRGWTAGSGVEVTAAIAQVAKTGACAIVVTDISRDGRLAGPDLRGVQELLDCSPLPLIASGGVSSLADLEALASLRPRKDRTSGGLAGVIVGKAIYEGRIDLGGALRALRAPGDDER